MVTARVLSDAEPRLRRVGEHIEELRRAGRAEDAEAVRFVRDLAAAVLRGLRPAQTRDLLTTGEAAQALGVSDQTVRNWAAAGRLPSVKRGVRTMIPREAVLREIERSRAPSDQGEPEPAEGDLAWRRGLLAALPPDLVARLDALHDGMEDGREPTPDEAAEMARLERAMAAAAARHLRGIIRRGRAGAA